MPRAPSSAPARAPRQPVELAEHRRAPLQNMSGGALEPLFSISFSAARSIIRPRITSSSSVTDSGYGRPARSEPPAPSWAPGRPGSPAMPGMKVGASARMPAPPCCPPPPPPPPPPPMKLPQKAQKRWEALHSLLHLPQTFMFGAGRAGMAGGMAGMAHPPPIADQSAYMPIAGSCIAGFPHPVLSARAFAPFLPLGCWAPTPVMPAPPAPRPFAPPCALAEELLPAEGTDPSGAGLRNSGRYCGSSACATRVDE
mmetsp:Transcript_58603/g.127262  ORF Transcript_58603/g.127262 Transcript_58603/m.127262 type:complete len:255 (+) Transcript_58603:100-864(+)